MTRLPGSSLGDAPLTDAQLDAIGTALNAMHDALPEPELVRLPPNPLRHRNIRRSAAPTTTWRTSSGTARGCG